MIYFIPNKLFTLKNKTTFKNYFISFPTKMFGKNNLGFFLSLMQVGYKIYVVKYIKVLVMLHQILVFKKPGNR